MKRDRSLDRSAKTLLKFAALTAPSFLLWVRSLRATFELASGNDAYNYILLVVPLSVALIYFEPKRLVEFPSNGQSAGWIGLALALLLHVLISDGIVLSSHENRLSLDMLALVMWWISGVVTCFGFHGLKERLFPLCFLLLVVPFPGVVINRITELLQHQSAVAVTGLFHAALVPVVRNGIVVSIPGLDLEVARECSSIRSSMLLLIVSLMFAHIFVRSWWGKLILVFAALPLAVAKNALRIFTIAELGIHIDPGYLNGRLHHDGGIIFFGIAVAASSSLVVVLKKAESAQTRRATMAEPKSF